MTATHTYTVLVISRAAFDEIRARLTESGYPDLHQDADFGAVIDMHGLALAPEGGQR